MKTFATAILTGVLATAGVAAVQANDTTHPADKQKPAVTNPDVRPQNPTAPVAGRNSFTELQAKGRMVEAGYTDVTVVRQDKDGLWHGTGVKNGMSHDVVLDYQGNVTVAK